MNLFERGSFIFPPNGKAQRRRLAVRWSALLSRTLRALDNALRISSADCSALSASQPADSADSAYGKLRLPPASLLIRNALAVHFLSDIVHPHIRPRVRTFCRTSLELEESFSLALRERFRIVQTIPRAS